MGPTASGGAGFGGRRVKHVVRVSFPTPGAPRAGPSGGGAVMRRSTAVAVLGGVVTLAAGAWVALVEGDVVADKHLAGVPLGRAAVGAVAAGLVLLVGGLLVTRRQRKAEAAYEDDYTDGGSEYVWPTIVVRRHGRPRQRPSARIVSVPPSTWPGPSPYHPSLAGQEIAAPMSSPVPLDDAWLPDNVQRLPFRS
jgi:hypothetical protein